MSCCKITKERMGQGHVLNIDMTFALKEDEVSPEEGRVDQIAARILDHCQATIAKRLKPALLKRAK